MSKHLRSLNQIKISTPCDADWESMIGNDQVRFCDHCNLHVTDLSTLTRRDALRLIEQSEGRLCVRFVHRANGSVLTKDIPEKLHLISRRVSRFAAGAFTAAVSLSSAAAQTRSAVEPRSTLPTPAATKPISAAVRGASVSGVVTDLSGALVSGALITLANKQTNTSITFTTADDGKYSFSLLESGSYSLTAEAPSFATSGPIGLDLPANAGKEMNFSLGIPEIIAEVEVKSEVEISTVTMGMVAISEPANSLIKAAYKNDLAAVAALLPQAADVNANDTYTSSSALDYAIQNNNHDMVNVLLSAGANMNNRNEKGQTPLMHLSGDATAEFVRELISLGAKADAQDKSGETVLMNAVGSCKFDVVKELIKAGARIDTKDEQGQTLLMHAATNEDPQVIKFLIATGLDVDAKNEDEESALMIAVRYGKGAALKALIDGGAAINLSPNDLDNALMTAVEGNDDSSTVKVLLEAGAHVSASDSERVTALMHAAKNGKPAAVKALIDAGADINAVDDRGWTALMHCDDVESARVLLNAGADMTVKNKDGETALSLAINSEQEEIVKLLKSRGAPE